jgi:energy-coupling factor transport system ATP-binding protein
VATDPAIVVDDLSFRYLGRKRSALSNVSFAVETGETLLVLGPSGGGKSTLALCLNGLIPHSIGGEMTGRVLIAGQDTRDATVAELSQSVGVVFQDPDSQLCMLRVDDEIAFGLENVRVPSHAMPGRIARALGLVGLAGRERARIDRLSGGTRQRVALAAVLALETRLLVFDEPTSNLDPVGADEVVAAITALRQRGDRTLVIVEHRLDQLISLVDRVLVLDDEGRVAALGTPRDVMREQAPLLERLGVWVPQVVDVARRLAIRGARPEPFPLTVEEAVLAYGPGITTPSRPSLPPDQPACTRHVARDPAIQISHLSHAYGGGVVALRDVSLTVPSGAFVAVVGPNGSGKSTLARHLIGSLRAPAGVVRVRGRDVRSTSAADLARLVGYVFQNPEHQFVARTAFDELAFGLRLRGDAAEQIDEEVGEMLASFGLDQLARANPFSLSHGEKRRLSVATMLILGQDVVVLDEPTFGQDRQNTDALMSRLVRLNQAGRTVVMITHDPRLVAEYADTVIALVDGRIAYHGPTAGAFASGEVARAAKLQPPPVLDLARKLGQLDPSFPPVARVDDFVDALAARLGLGPEQTESRVQSHLPGARAVTALSRRGHA